jgi:microcin C transport system ATP-binding protein
MTLLSVRDLSVAFKQGGKTTLAVDNISFDIAHGETVALVGESGSGKSVTALSILKLLSTSNISGKILFENNDLIDKDERDLRKVRGNDITMIFQEPMTSLNPLHVVEDQIAEVLKLHQGMSKKQAQSRVLELLEQVGIRDAAKRLKAYPHQLSGGQRQRVMIAMALANTPKLLIADEPTTALDVTVQAQILKLLSNLKAKNGMSMLFITHDLGIVRKIADRVCVMKHGKIVETGKTSDIFANPQHEYTKHLLSCEPKGLPPLQDLTAPIVMEAENIKVWFPIKAGIMRKTVDHVKAVNTISLTIRAGQTLGIVGESGSGKTTLGLALARMIASEGRITFLGNDIQKYGFAKMRNNRKDLQVVFQDPYGSLSPRMSVSDIISEGLFVHEKNLNKIEIEQKVCDVMYEVGLDSEARHRYAHEFSGGQRQRIAIARAMILKPKFVMLDEPTSALDMSVQAQVVDLLRDLQKKHGLAYLFISHDLKVVRALANDIMVMKNGVVVEQGASTQVFETPQTEYTKTLMVAAFNTP